MHELVPVLEVDAQEEHGGARYPELESAGFAPAPCCARRRLPARRDSGCLRGDAGPEARARARCSRRGSRRPSRRCASATVRTRWSDFRLRKGDTVTLEVVDADGQVVRTLFERRRFGPVRLEAGWDGKDDEGRVVPDGDYRPRVRLADAHRTIVFPNEIRVDTVKPRIERFSVSRRVISPDGDGRADGVSISYRLSERGRVRLLVNGKQRVRKLGQAPTGAIQWFGRFRGRAARPRLYRLELVAVDDAGNRSERCRGAGSRPLRRAGLDVIRVRAGNSLRRAGEHRRAPLRLALRRRPRKLVGPLPGPPGAQEAGQLPPVRPRERPGRLGACRGDGERRERRARPSRSGSWLPPAWPRCSSRRSGTSGSRASQRSQPGAPCWPATSCRAAPRSCSRPQSWPGVPFAIAGALVLRRWPWLLPLAALACVPARIPVDVGDTEANLLLPLYAVIAAAGVSARLEPVPRRGRAARARPDRLAARRASWRWPGSRWPGATIRARARSRCSSSSCPSGCWPSASRGFPGARVPLRLRLRPARRDGRRVRRDRDLPVDHARRLLEPQGDRRQRATRPSTASTRCSGIRRSTGASS